MLEQAFNLVLQMASRSGSLVRPGSPDQTFTVKYATSNYFRNLEGPSSTISQGREFVLSKSSLEAVSYPVPIKRNDRIVDADMGTMIISEVREMMDIHGIIIGYRVRIS